LYRARVHILCRSAILQSKNPGLSKSMEHINLFEHRRDFSNNNVSFVCISS